MPVVLATIARSIDRRLEAVPVAAMLLMSAMVRAKAGATDAERVIVRPMILDAVAADDPATPRRATRIRMEARAAVPMALLKRAVAIRRINDGVPVLAVLREIATCRDETGVSVDAIERVNPMLRR